MGSDPLQEGARTTLVDRIIARMSVARHPHVGMDLEKKRT